MLENTSKEYYNALAKDYNHLSLSKSAYITSINKIIDKYANGDVKRYLDIGCGDGIRTRHIIESIKPQSSTLVDTSEEMIIRSRKNVLGVSHKCIDPIELDEGIQFDLVTSLWNVIGHFPNPEYKVNFFKKINALLSEDGIYILDVNNRFNISNYGIISVVRNVIRGILCGTKSGFYELKANNQVNTRVYIHKPNELESYISKANLTVVNKLYINYKTGAIMKNCFSGQILYILKKCR